MWEMRNWLGKCSKLMGNEAKCVLRANKIKYPILVNWAKKGVFWTIGFVVDRLLKMEVCGDHELNPDEPIGGNWDQFWPPGILRKDLQKILISRIDKDKSFTFIFFQSQS